MNLGNLVAELRGQVRTFVLGDDPAKHKLCADTENAFYKGKAYFQTNSDTTADGLYNCVVQLAKTVAGNSEGQLPITLSASFHMNEFPTIRSSSTFIQKTQQKCEPRVAMDLRDIGFWKSILWIANGRSVLSSKSF
jgi:hypothetical protein